jgi:hypothetical protein
MLGPKVDVAAIVMNVLTCFTTPRAAVNVEPTARIFPTPLEINGVNTEVAERLRKNADALVSVAVKVEFIESVLSLPAFPTREGTKVLLTAMIRPIDRTIRGVNTDVADRDRLKAALFTRDAINVEETCRPLPGALVITGVKVLVAGRVRRSVRRVVRDTPKVLATASVRLNPRNIETVTVLVAASVLSTVRTSVSAAVNVEATAKVFATPLDITEEKAEVTAKVRR